MAQSINKNHNKNEITTYTDDSFYIYLNGKWSKPSYVKYTLAFDLDTYEHMILYDKTLMKDGDVIKVDYDTPHVESDSDETVGYYMYKAEEQNFDYMGRYQPLYKNDYYKFYDTDISTLNAEKFKSGDYIISYKSRTNHIKYSESFKDCKVNNRSQWLVNGMDTTTVGEVYKFPNTNKNASKFQTNNQTITRIKKDGTVVMNESSGNVEHGMSQMFYTKPNELYIASCMIKQDSVSSHNLAFQFFDDTYNIGISAKYDLNDLTNFDASGYKSIPYTFLNKDFTDISDSGLAERFHNVEAGLYKIDVSPSDYYFRLVLKCSCEFKSQMKVKILILNNESEYKYSSKEGQAKYIMFMNAFQLEKYSDLTVQKPYNYIMTASKSTTFKLYDGLYKVIPDHDNPNILVIEKLTNNLYYIYDIEETYEDNPGGGVITRLKSFKPNIPNPLNSDIAIVPSMISFSEYKNTIGNVNDDSVVKFGDTFLPQNPSDTINYDMYNTRYIIKKGSSYKILSYKTEEKNRKSMVKAMTFNQGYFETWGKQHGIPKYGYNTGGGFNFTRMKSFYPKY